MPAGPPERCPECGEIIVAPLMRAVCSECSFEYDEHTIVWRPSRPWSIYIMFANAAICVPFLFQFLQSVALYGRLPHNAVTAAAAVGIAALGWALPRLRVLLTEGYRYAAVTPLGIYAGTTRGRRIIPWAQLADVRVSFGIPIVLPVEPGRPCELDWVFDSDQEVTAFIAAVRASAARYHPAPIAAPSM